MIKQLIACLPNWERSTGHLKLMTNNMVVPLIKRIEGQDEYMVIEKNNAFIDIVFF